MDKRMRSMNGHFKKATKDPNIILVYSRDTDDINVWYVLIRNIECDNGEFDGGEYLFKMTATDEFPFKPPHFIALTHNGVYKRDETVCIDIGQYHPSNYRAAGGMGNFIMNLAGGLMQYDTLVKNGGINLIHTTVSKKKKYAAESRQFNEEKYGYIIESMKEQFAEYSSNWNLSKFQPEEIKKLDFYNVKFSDTNIDESDNNQLDVIKDEEKDHSNESYNDSGKR